MGNLGETVIVDCAECDNACCKFDDKIRVVLIDGIDDMSIRHKETPVAEDAVMRTVLVDDNNRCIYLNDEKGCKIYDNRPASCRAFENCELFGRTRTVLERIEE